MASKASSRPAPRSLDDLGLDTYGIDDDDPFKSPPPELRKNGDHNGIKRKGTSADLGIDEEVTVTKRARVPNVKLDEKRLLSDKGIPKLRTKFKTLKFKGKGHEFSDAARLLAFYQLWLDDLVPKFRFLDALAMVEKAGHRVVMRKARADWIDEGKPGWEKKAAEDDEDGADRLPRDRPTTPTASGLPPVAPIFKTAATINGTAQDDVPDIDEDIYGASPRVASSRTVGALGLTPSGSIFGRSAAPFADDDDLDALMAEAEAEGPGPRTGASKLKPTAAATDVPGDEDIYGATPLPAPSIFGPRLTGPVGDGEGVRPRPVPAEDNLLDEDLDALMAEAEAETSTTVARNVQKDHGSEKVASPLKSVPASAASDRTTSATAVPTPAIADGGDDEFDDLDALMAEAEATSGQQRGLVGEQSAPEKVNTTVVETVPEGGGRNVGVPESTTAAAASSTVAAAEFEASQEADETDELELLMAEADEAV